tara:strand:+ start:22899 stop:23684 length:786 start_codon:yes stop_codon:yes gene_type:complete
MIKKMTLQIAVITVLLITSCNSDKKKAVGTTSENNVQTETVDLAHTSKNALDWKGAYKGTLPCADCEGIKTALTLNEDASYLLEEVYLGKNDSAFKTQGTFKWDAGGQKIILSDADRNPYYVGENILFHLDKSGNKITGDLANKYVLSKNRITFTDTKWKLIKLMGKDIDDEKSFISFSTEDNRVFGNNSCNNFSASYKMEEGNRITLSKFVSTMMACPDMETEKQFTDILEKADNYALNGNTMTLNKAKMAPLAVFEAQE